MTQTSVTMAGLAIFAGVVAIAAQDPAAGITDRFDVIVRHGTVVDGTGGRPFRADVGIAGTHIARVGDLSRSEAGREIDATGLYVAPGFINLHSHAVPLALPTAENMLLQGVTTELLNPDGGGSLDLAAQLTEAAASGLAVHIGAYIGFNAAWTKVVGETDRRPDAGDLQRMRAILETNLDAGAWGVSAGLDYKPAYFASAEEVVEVVKAAAPWRTNFTNHDRLTPETGYSSRAAVAETIAIAGRAGLAPVVTHMKVQGREQGSAAGVLGLLQAATRRGTYTAADVYPYLAGQSGLGALLIPGWAQDGGRAAMLERFRDPDTRARIVAETEEAMAARFGGPAGVYLTASRRELIDVMREMNVGAGEAVVRLLEAENQGAILRFGSEADLVRILQHPTTSIACDCGATPPGRASHPRYYGSYPRVLGRYVREQQALSWQDAVRKMTLLPAATVGMVDRGVVAPGMVADLTVFDPATVIDHATFEQPTAPPDGIRHVLVNGGAALLDGRPTGARHGSVLRRGRHMPSRATSGNDRRRLAVKTTVTPADNSSAGAEVSADLTQAAGERRARGTIAGRGPGGRIFDVRELGVLQLAERWASVTGSVRDPDGTYRPFLLIVDEGDPRDSGGVPAARVMVGGLFDLTGRTAAGAVRIGR